jgi:hypothetical protein
MDTTADEHRGSSVGVLRARSVGVALAVLTVAAAAFIGVRALADTGHPSTSAPLMPKPLTVEHNTVRIAALSRVTRPPSLRRPLERASTKTTDSGTGTPDATDQQQPTGTVEKQQTPPGNQGTTKKGGSADPHSSSVDPAPGE